MKREISVNVEPLETRSLLSGLTYSLTTNQAVYQPGQPVQMTLTETNTSSSPVQGAWGGVGSVGFTVEQNGNVVAAFLTDPVIDSWTLQPGQSKTLTTTWNGKSMGAYATGEFSVTSGFTPAGVSATFQIEPASSASSPISVTVTTAHRTYKAGRPVLISVTVKNVSSREITLALNSKTVGVAILEGSTVVWHSPTIKAVEKNLTLNAGQSVHVSFVWNGKPNQPGVHKLAAGTYTIEVVVGGYGGAGTFQIG